jgi:maltooligosyltrehalose trehalohydrolase
MLFQPALGATYTPRETTFHVWAPLVENVEVHLLDKARYVPLQPARGGYFTGVIRDVPPGARYLYRLDGEKERPDPASKSQPEGVHGPSAVVDNAFAWEDDGWRPPSLRNSVMYELHVGAFTEAGTFDAIIPHLAGLRELGVTTLQLMPIVQFPGARNWGYDGVQLFAPHHDYGGAAGLKRLVNAAHGQGLAVMLDAVYNHLGPEGNYLWDYGAYFTNRYHSPWGDSVNLDGPDSDAVRRFFIENALQWFEHYHIDGLRLDATHALVDFSARPFLAELTATVDDWADRHNRHVHLIAENDRSDRLLTLSRDANGFGLDGQWLDDLHHVLHVALTGEADGYYSDYQDFALLPKVLRERFAYTGQYSPARRRRHGTTARDIPADRFIVATQTHDQIGNRMNGERLTQLTDLAGLKLAAALLAASPYVPMLFMGEEYGEAAPFLFFVSYGDPGLIEAVRKGRAEEFAAFDWAGEPPDPQAEATFARCKLNHALRTADHHRVLYTLYRALLTLRRTYPALTNPDPGATTVYSTPANRLICLERRDGPEALRIFLSFERARTVTLPTPEDEVPWRKIVDSEAAEWSPDGKAGPLAPDGFRPGEPFAVTLPAKGFAIYLRTEKDG